MVLLGTVASEVGEVMESENCGQLDQPVQQVVERGVLGHGLEAFRLKFEVHVVCFTPEQEHEKESLSIYFRVMLAVLSGLLQVISVEEFHQIVPQSLVILPTKATFLVGLSKGELTDSLESSVSLPALLYVTELEREKIIKPVAILQEKGQIFVFFSAESS